MERKWLKRIGVASLVVTAGTCAGLDIPGQFVGSAARLVDESSRGRSDALIRTCDGITEWNTIQNTVKEDTKNNPDRRPLDHTNNADVAEYIDRYNEIKHCK
jgi:hypothetical protein